MYVLPSGWPFGFKFQDAITTVASITTTTTAAATAASITTITLCFHFAHSTLAWSRYGDDAQLYDDELSRITDWLERLDEAGHTDDVRPHLASFRQRFPFTMVDG